MLHEESQKQVEYGRDDVALEGAEGDRLYVARRVGEILAGNLGDDGRAQHDQDARAG